MGPAQLVVFALGLIAAEQPQKKTSAGPTGAKPSPASFGENILISPAFRQPQLRQRPQDHIDFPGLLRPKSRMADILLGVLIQQNALLF